MQSHHVELLYTVARFSGSHNDEVAKGQQRASTAPEKTDDRRLLQPCRLGSEDQVLRVSARAEEKDDVSRFGEGLYGAGEDVIEAVVVGDAGHMCRVREGDRGHRGSVVTKPSREFLRDVHGIGEAAAVTGRHQLAPGFEADGEHVDDFVERGAGFGPEERKQPLSFREGSFQRAVHGGSVLSPTKSPRYHQISMNSFGPVAAHYDRLMDNIPYRMWTSYLQLLFAVQEVKPRKLLDVCCGTGNMCELLSDEDFDVTGFDLSAPMIEEAREKTRLREIAGKKPIRYEVADAATFELNDKFEAAYSFFDSLNYIHEPEQLQKAMHRVAAHLEPGGSFIFDVNTAYAFEEQMFDQQSLRKNSPLRYRWRGNWDPETRIIRVDMKFWAGEEEFTETHVQRAYDDDEIRAMLKAAGFEKIKCYHSYTLEKPRETSDRLHYVARLRSR